MLAERHHWLRALALNELRDPVRFWDKMNQWPVAANVPADVKAILMRALPESAVMEKIIHRPGRFGQPGPAAIYSHSAMARRLYRPRSQGAGAFGLALDRPGKGAKIFYSTTITQAVRSPTRWFCAQKQWFVRRLAPDCSRIELNQLPQKRDELKLLHAMGFETANIHLGTPSAVKKIAADLRKRPSRWLFNAAQAMESATINDWKQWRKAPVGRGNGAKPARSAAGKAPEKAYEKMQLFRSLLSSKATVFPGANSWDWLGPGWRCPWLVPRLGAPSNFRPMNWASGSVRSRRLDLRVFILLMSTRMPACISEALEREISKLARTAGLQPGNC